MISGLKKKKEGKGLGFGSCSIDYQKKNLVDLTAIFTPFATTFNLFFTCLSYGAEKKQDALHMRHNWRKKTPTS